MYKYVFTIISIFTIILILNTVRKKLLSISESFFWLCGGLGMLILSAFPKLLDNIAIWVGVDYPPSLLFAFAVLFLILINFRHSKLLTSQKEQIIELSQNIALLQEKIKK